MERELFLSNIKTSIYGKCLSIFNTIDSTNKYALKCLENSSVEEGHVYLAYSQTNGKGSYGNDWDSDKPLGLWITIVTHNPYKKCPLPFVPALSLCKMLKEVYKLKNVHVKWPNDVLVGNKKIAGVLCQETTTINKNKACAIGVGVNVFHEEKDFNDNIKSKATSMKIARNENYSLEDIYKNYMEYFEAEYTNDSNLIEEWSKHSKMIGKNIKAVRNKNEILNAKVLGITKDGFLEVLVNGEKEVWISRSSLDIEINY